jgi:hypothetical protein
VRVRDDNIVERDAIDLRRQQAELLLLRRYLDAGRLPLDDERSHPP